MKSILIAAFLFYIVQIGLANRAHSLTSAHLGNGLLRGIYSLQEGVHKILLKWKI